MQRHIGKLQQRLDGLARRVRDPRRHLEELAQRLDDLERRAGQTLAFRMRLMRQRLSQLHRRFVAQDPRLRLAREQQRLAALQRRMAPAMTRQLGSEKQRIGQLSQRLHTASPLATLARGYSITLQENVPLRSVSGLTPGQQITSRLTDGELVSRIEKVTPEKENR